MNWKEEKIYIIIYDMLKVTKTDYETAKKITNRLLNQLYEDEHPRC